MKIPSDGSNNLIYLDQVKKSCWYASSVQVFLLGFRSLFEGRCEILLPGVAREPSWSTAWCVRLENLAAWLVRIIARVWMRHHIFFPIKFLGRFWCSSLPVQHIIEKRAKLSLPERPIGADGQIGREGREDLLSWERRGLLTRQFTQREQFGKSGRRCCWWVCHLKSGVCLEDRYISQRIFLLLPRFNYRNG